MKYISTRSDIAAAGAAIGRRPLQQEAGGINPQRQYTISTTIKDKPTLERWSALFNSQQLNSSRQPIGQLLHHRGLRLVDLFLRRWDVRYRNDFHLAINTKCASITLQHEQRGGEFCHFEVQPLYPIKWTWMAFGCLEWLFARIDLEIFGSQFANFTSAPFPYEILFFIFLNMNASSLIFPLSKSTQKLLRK